MEEAKGLASEAEQLQQNTDAWLAFRKSRIGSSDASIIMNVSSYKTPHQLWLEKTGKVETERSTSFVANRGNRFEPAARARYELKTGLELPADIVVHPIYWWLMASLDGYDKPAGVILEIKCFTSKKNFEMAKAGIVPPMYVPQVQEQLLVAGAKEVHFFCCLIEKVGYDDAIVDEALVIVKPDPEYQQEMLVRLMSFHKCMTLNIAPPLTERDYLEADDQSTVFLFSKLKAIKIELHRKQDLLERVKAEIAELDRQLGEVKAEAVSLKADEPEAAQTKIELLEDTIETMRGTPGEYAETVMQLKAAQSKIAELEIDNKWQSEHMGKISQDNLRLIEKIQALEADIQNQAADMRNKVLVIDTLKAQQSNQDEVVKRLKKCAEFYRNEDNLYIDCDDDGNGFISEKSEESIYNELGFVAKEALAECEVLEGKS